MSADLRIGCGINGATRFRQRIHDGRNHRRVAVEPGHNRCLRNVRQVIFQQAVNEPGIAGAIRP